MTSLSYVKRRGELETYFDRTASKAWARLTSDAPVSGVRATVRAGRDAMRATLLSYLPDDLTGKRVLDAGCGTGALAFEAARRGAEVVAVDLAGTLVHLARTRVPADLGTGSVMFLTGDMLSADLGEFDHVVAMDSIIHYAGADMVRVLDGLAARTRGSIICRCCSWPASCFRAGIGRRRSCRSVRRICWQDCRALLCGRGSATGARIAFRLAFTNPRRWSSCGDEWNPLGQ
jgi:magnesium protoporphyrin O-methyltransferase